MTLGPAAFAAVLWAAVGAVVAVFAYVVYVLAVDAGWLDGSSFPSGRDG